MNATFSATDLDQTFLLGISSPHPVITHAAWTMPTKRG